MGAAAHRTAGNHRLLRASGVSDRGPVRTTNEDCFAIALDLNLCVIADGMGGHNAGEVAARLAVETIVDSVRRRLTPPAVSAVERDPQLSTAANVLDAAVRAANLRVLEAAANEDEYSGMGTTIVAFLVEPGRLTVAHVGDSRGYLFSGRTFRQLTRDDSWVAAMLKQDPTADPRVLGRHPMRHALTNVVGAGRELDIHVWEERLDHGALVALTTDGVHGVLENDAIERLLAENSDVEMTARRLVQAALACGSRDNCTAVVAEHLGG